MKKVIITRSRQKKIKQGQKKQSNSFSQSV